MMRVSFCELYSSDIGDIQGWRLVGVSTRVVVERSMYDMCTQNIWTRYERV